MYRKTSSVKEGCDSRAWRKKPLSSGGRFLSGEVVASESVAPAPRRITTFLSALTEVTTPVSRPLRTNDLEHCGLDCRWARHYARATYNRGGIDGLRDENSRDRARGEGAQPLGRRPAADHHPRHLPPGLVVQDQQGAEGVRRGEGLRPRSEPDQLGAGAVPGRVDHHPGADHLLARDQARAGRL